MRINGFPFCCGARIITGLHNQPKADIRRYLSKQVDSYITEGGISFLIVALTGLQFKRLGGTLRDAGFREVAKARILRAKGDTHLLVYEHRPVATRD